MELLWEPFTETAACLPRGTHGLAGARSRRVAGERNLTSK